MMDMAVHVGGNGDYGRYVTRLSDAHRVVFIPLAVDITYHSGFDAPFLLFRYRMSHSAPLNYSSQNPS